MFRQRASDNESTYQDIIARLDIEPGGNVQERGLRDDVEPKDRALAASATAWALSAC